MENLGALLANLVSLEHNLVSLTRNLGSLQRNLGTLTACRGTVHGRRLVPAPKLGTVTAFRVGLHANLATQLRSRRFSSVVAVG